MKKSLSLLLSIALTAGLMVMPAVSSAETASAALSAGAWMNSAQKVSADEYDQTAGHWKFDFGAEAAEGYIGVNHNKSYTDDLTYGFIGLKDDDYKLTMQEHIDGFRMVKGQKITLADGLRKDDEPDNDFVAVNNPQYPIRFVMGAENGGYYKVKVTLVNASDSERANVTLFTEKRHQLLTNKEIEPGGKLEYEFNVDVETFYWKALNGRYKDDTISVSVAGENAAISSMEVTKLEQKGTTLWVLGDSTGCDQVTNFPYFNLASIAGVGQGLTKYLPSDIAMSNQGDGGLASSDTDHYACAKAGFKTGDYLYVEYGHNDTNIEKYKENLQGYYEDCHSAGVKMIVVGPIDRVQTKDFNKADGTWNSTLGKYSEAGRAFVEEKIAEGAEDIAFVDLNEGWLEFLNKTTKQVKQIRSENSGTEQAYEADSTYYYYRYKTSGIDTTHINEGGADNAAYIFFSEAKKMIEDAKNGGTKSVFNVNSEETVNAVLYAASYTDGTLSSIKAIEKTLTPGVNTIDVTGINADKFMLWDEHMNPLMPGDAKPDISEIPDEQLRSVQIQAAVLADLADGMRDNKPYTITEETVNAGKVPNSLYPDPVYEEYEGYEATVIRASFDGHTLKNIAARVQHYTGLDKKDIPYAVAIAEVYDADGTLAGTYQSTAGTKYDATNGNGTFTFVFDDKNAVVPEGGSYKIWLQGFTSDHKLMEGDNYRISAYYTPDHLSDTYLIGDFEDISLPDTFSYYGVKPGADLSGNNGWYLAGSAERSAVLEKEADGTGCAKLEKSSTGGSYVLYRTFDGAVNSSKIVIDTDVYYESGYMKFTLSNKTKTPNAGYSQSIDCFAIDENGKLLDTEKREIGSVPANEWIHVTYVLDMDYGTQRLTIGNNIYEYDAEGMNSLILSEVAPSEVQQLNISGSSSSMMSAKIKNMLVKNTVQETLPDCTLTLAEVNPAEGEVYITNGEGLTKTDVMNSEIEIRAVPADGYVFVGWYDNHDTLVSGTEKVMLRLHKDVTLTAKFEADNDPINYAYKQTFTALTNDTLSANGFVSPSAQSALSINNDDNYGNYLYFNPGGNTRNVKFTLPESAHLTEKYSIEMDFGVSSGNSAMSEFTILTADTGVPNNTSVTGAYLLKLTSTAKSASNSKTMIWTVNDNAEDTITFTQNGTNPTWAHLKMTVDPLTKTAEVIITEKDNELYAKTINISGDTAVYGFNFKAGKSYAKGQFDNIKIYAASQIAQ